MVCGLNNTYLGSGRLLLLHVLVTRLLTVGENTEDEQELDSSDASRQQKPWGYTHHFCPVALRDFGVLWPGNNEIALRYVLHGESKA